ncbi:ABC transporter permease [Modestobacter muralis]|uniref:Transport permease protein n=1 Tax=Modestobacter muralis TaxID=1608614 RepID=A0A6P0H331_9ACTN|nr:ABC transporter permease [Modestobacter muralis]NEK92828.1 ABC transporter permease [Modestobacter muralis]NEN49595.1 ABC transporter permease [Modestobacter muralis]
MTTMTPPRPTAPLPTRATSGNALQQALTLAWRNVVKTRRQPEALMDVSLQPIIFTVLFVFVFGGAIAGDWRTYLTYLVPGILVQTLMFATGGIGVALNNDITKGVFDRFRSLPIARSAPLIGAVFADVVRYLTATVVLLAFTFALGFRTTQGLPAVVLAVAVGIGFAMCLSWVFVWIGLKVRSAGAVQGVGFLATFPLTFGSTALVQADTLPGWLQAFTKNNPVTHLIDTVRGLLLGGPVAEPLAWTAGWGALLLVVFVPLAMRAYRRRV